MAAAETAEAVRDVFTSQAVQTKYGTPSNIADIVGDAVLMLNKLAVAVSNDAAPGTDATGGHINCLTESVMGITAGLVRVADAIHDLAAAVRERG